MDNEEKVKNKQSGNVITSNKKWLIGHTSKNNLSAVFFLRMQAVLLVANILANSGRV